MIKMLVKSIKQLSKVNVAFNLERQLEVNAL